MYAAQIEFVACIPLLLTEKDMTNNEKNTALDIAYELYLKKCRKDLLYKPCETDLTCIRILEEGEPVE